MNQPEKAYIVCATPRSGTTLLCDLLTETTIAGQPDSFFRRQSLRWWADYLGVSCEKWSGEDGFDLEYLAAVRREGAQGTGVFGMRLMWESVDLLSKRLAVYYPDHASEGARFSAAFGPLHYIHLSREDKVAQGISRLKAEQTGLWHVDMAGAERERLKPAMPAVYDAQALHHHVEQYRKQDAAWVSWFDEQGIHPLHITYETLADQPQATTDCVLRAIGLNPRAAKTVTPRTRPLADDQSREWAMRFRAEYERW